MSPRQSELFRVIRAAMENGFTPSVTELAARKWRCKGDERVCARTIVSWIRELEALRLLERVPHKNRALRLLPRGKAA